MHLSRRTAALLLAGSMFPVFALFVPDRDPAFASTKCQTVTASPTPTPSPTSDPTPRPSPAQSVDDLRSRIRQRLFSPAVRRGRVGVKIVSLATGTVIFEQDSEKYFMPASNMKNFTVAAALERLTPDFRFVTSVFAGAPPDDQGVVKGDLRIFGRGDVSISGAFYDGDPLKGIDTLADKIIGAGVKRIEGSLVGDESYFKGNPIPPTWEAARPATWRRPGAGP